MKILISMFSIILITSCSSRKFERDYQFVDSSHEDLPEWVEDFDEWANDLDENKKYKYYKSQSEASTSRELACEIAKAKAAGDVGSEISQNFKQKLASFKESTITDSNLEYISNEFSKTVNQSIVGLETAKTYWEKRRFKEELGASKDMDGYVCYSLAKISYKNLKQSISRAQKILDKKLDDKHQKIINKIIKDM